MITCCVGKRNPAVTLSLLLRGFSLGSLLCRQTYRVLGSSLIRVRPETVILIPVNQNRNGFYKISDILYEIPVYTGIITKTNQNLNNFLQGHGVGQSNQSHQPNQSHQSLQSQQFLPGHGSSSQQQYQDRRSGFNVPGGRQNDLDNFYPQNQQSRYNKKRRF